MKRLTTDNRDGDIFWGITATCKNKKEEIIEKEEKETWLL